ncbi:unnamed protein product [Trichobilharzia regenti]|nr:unnamed protein product [Trichobilharzia regenti]
MFRSTGNINNNKTIAPCVTVGSEISVQQQQQQTKTSCTQLCRLIAYYHHHHNQHHHCYIQSQDIQIRPGKTRNYHDLQLIN